MELIPTFDQVIDFADSSQSCRDRHPHFPSLVFLNIFPVFLSLGFE